MELRSKWEKQGKSPAEIVQLLHAFKLKKKRIEKIINIICATKFNQNISEWNMTMTHEKYSGMFYYATEMNKYENKKPAKIRK